MQGRTALLLLAAALAGAIAAATAVAAPTGHSAVKAGKIVFCSDTTYPPMESIVGGRVVGADVDIANAVARNIGTTAQIKSTDFAGIIHALLHRKCDAIISAMTDNPQRRTEVEFADYITVGMLLMVKKGNPSHITGLASLSGKSVAVQEATIEKARLDAQNRTFAKQGKPKITIKVYPVDTSAADELLAGRVDAYFSDAIPVLYYIKKTSGKFQAVGAQIDPAPEGIATRKGDPLHARFEQAIATLYADGTMKKILATWGLSAFALKR